MPSGRAPDRLDGRATTFRYSLSMQWLRLFGVIAWLGIFVIWPRSTAAITRLVVASAFIGFNGMIFWVTVIRKELAPAVVPIFGGVLGAAGVALLPFPESWKWAGCRS